jgi:hypothetical protein
MDLTSNRFNIEGCFEIFLVMCFEAPKSIIHEGPLVSKVKATRNVFNISESLETLSRLSFNSTYS